jgi:ssDNA-binding Zn-finger/Zn-ribbon topoisomerase 1
MSKFNAKNFTEEEIKSAIQAGRTMGGAAKVLNIDWRTFKKEADRYGLYEKQNSGGKKFELKDILNGLHPQYPTSKIIPRLVKEGIKEYKCEGCGINAWNEKRIGLELNHIDGNNSNHRLENLEILCPNCHSQTDTFKSRNIKKKKEQGGASRLVTAPLLKSVER